MNLIPPTAVGAPPDGAAAPAAPPAGTAALTPVETADCTGTAGAPPAGGGDAFFLLATASIIACITFCGTDAFCNAMRPLAEMSKLFSLVFIDPMMTASGNPLFTIEITSALVNTSPVVDCAAAGCWVYLTRANRSVIARRERTCSARLSI